jgi:hypothetical protein
MNKSKRVLIVIVVVSFSLAGAWLAPQAVSALRPVRVRQPQLLEPVDESVVRPKGALEYASFTDLRNEAGRSLPILHIAPEGKRAEKGAVLVELDAGALLNEMDQQVFLVKKAQAQLAAAESNFVAERQESAAMIELAEKGIEVAEGALKVFAGDGGEHELQLRAIEGEIALGEQRLVVAAGHEHLITQRIQANEAPRSQLEEAKLASFEARMQLELAKTRLLFLKESVYAQKTSELRLAIEKKKLELIRARNKLSTANAMGEAAIMVERANYELQRGSLKRLEEQIAACKIYAPEAGIVFHPARMPRVGADLAALKTGAIARDGQVLLRLADKGRLKLDVRVSLALAQKLAPGRDVTLRFDALDDRTFSGRIVTMGVISPPRPPVQARVTIRPDDPDGELRVGMTASVELDSPKTTGR